MDVDSSTQTIIATFHDKEKKNQGSQRRRFKKKKKTKTMFYAYESIIDLKKLVNT